ncbi:hypothetical protein [Streptomyces sp. NPDC089919]|uniref:hypothetical protein n=1 Tax=Streptomyces sp. NPDC089919 TaxID=3155188 RepID=UPI0034309460
MSQGLAYPSISEIFPTVGYAPAADAGNQGAALAHGVGSVTDGAGQAVDGMHTAAGHAVDGLHATAGHAVDGVHAAAGHAVDAAGHALHQLLEPAAVALGALSGALFVGRAALVTTQVLAAAAVRAADEQRCLERGQEVAAAVNAQWEAAAFAAVRANARRTALLARVRRAAFGTVPDTPPPPMPDLPPALTCTGTRLDVLRRELARLEAALTEAEAAQARWVTEQALHLADGPADAAWRQRVLARREAAARARQPVEEAAPAALPQPPAADRLDRPAAEEAGAALLALLEPGADRRDAELAVTAVRHAVDCAADRPAKARTHLREARRFVADANRAVRDRLAALEKAAVQLDFLLTQAPSGQPSLAAADQEITLLREALEKGRPLGAEDQRTVDRRVDERVSDLECRYTQELIGLAVARLADPAAAAPPATTTGGGETAGGAPGEPLRFDLTPAGWWPGHWLRITVREGTTELVTMYEEGSGPRGPAELARDAQRCREARGHLTQLREAARRSGLELPLTFTETGTAVPGVRGAEGAIVLEAVDTDGTHPDVHDHDHEGGYRTVDRPAERPKARRADGGSGR